VCQICIDWDKGSLTNEEALRNTGEIIQGLDDRDQEQAQHYFELLERIIDDDPAFLYPEDDQVFYPLDYDEDV